MNLIFMIWGKKGGVENGVNFPCFRDAEFIR